MGQFQPFPIFFRAVSASLRKMAIYKAGMLLIDTHFVLVLVIKATEMKVLAVVALCALILCAQASDDQAPKKGPKITNRVYFDIEIDGKEAGTKFLCFHVLLCL